MITAAEAQELRKLINILIDATTKCAQWYGNDNEYDARREAFADVSPTSHAVKFITGSAAATTTAPITATPCGRSAVHRSLNTSARFHPGATSSST